MLADTGLTALGWAFMLLSITAVTVLVSWCYRAILSRRHS